MRLLLAGWLLAAACGGGDDGAAPEAAAPGSVATTSTTAVPAIDGATPGVNQMCDVIRSAPASEAGTEATLRHQLDRRSAVAPVATLCDQDSPGTFVLVEVDEAMIAFCAHFDLNGTIVR